MQELRDHAILVTVCSGHTIRLLLPYRAAEAELRSSVSLLDCANAVFHCFGASHQFDRLYKDGHFDDCVRQRREVSLCLELRFAAAGEPTRAVLAQLARGDTSTTEGVVWQRRERADAPAAAEATKGGSLA